MAPLKTKGDTAELLVAGDLAKRGFRIAFPYGEDCDFDLLFWRPPSIELERVQVKYATSDGAVVPVRPCSHSLTKGRIKATKRYTSATIDWLAVYDSTTERIFYVSAAEFGDGMRSMSLRLVPARNNQRSGIRMADDYSMPTIRAMGL